MAKSKTKDPTGKWEYINKDALTSKLTWTTGENFWAPDVRKLTGAYGTSYVMYVSGVDMESKAFAHCVGVARSKNITGPYELDDEAFECPRSVDGAIVPAIDPSGFQDPKTGKMYVVWKVDGNDMKFRPRGDCGLDLDGSGGTPLMIQEVSPEDGTTRLGKPAVMLDRVAREDGPLIESPNLVLAPDGKYLLFYSSHCFSSDKYDIKYAWASHAMGPYQRGTVLLQTGDLGLIAPGGMTSTIGFRQGNGTKTDLLVFHGRCKKKKARCMYVAPWGLVGLDKLDWWDPNKGYVVEVKLPWWEQSVVKDSG
jgi:hypothetical protein